MANNYVLDNGGPINSPSQSKKLTNVEENAHEKAADAANQMMEQQKNQFTSIK